MADILVEVTVTSQQDGSLIQVSFPMDEGFYKAIMTLPEEDRIPYFTDEFTEWNHLHNQESRHDGGSLDAEDEELEFIHDIPDEAPTPKEYCLKKERDLLLEKAISHLSWRQRFVILQIYYFNHTHEEVADMMGLDRTSVTKLHLRALAKLKEELEGKI